MKLPILLFVVVLSASVAPAPGAVTTFGAMGDSLTDEYAEESYDYASCWTELLVAHRGLDMGPTAAEAGQPGGSWDDTRRTGFRDNWARFGDTTSQMLIRGQHTGLAGSVLSHGVGHAAMFVGGNDFSPWLGTYTWIYDGTWGSAQIASHVGTVIANYRTVLETVLPTGVKLVVVNIPDFSIMPSVWEFHPDPDGREQVTAAVIQANAGIRDLADEFDLALVDMFALTKAIFGTNHERNELLAVGGVDIELLVKDTTSHTRPTAAWVDDGTHAHTTIQGIWANAVATAFNAVYDGGIVPFTEAEILAHAGLAYGGQDTLSGKLGPSSAYVIDFTGANGPGRLPDGAPLRVDKADGSPGSIVLRWDRSCSPGATDYAVYEGSIGTWQLLAPATCTTGGLESWTLTPGAPGSFYVVVPRRDDVEGGYGFDSTGKRARPVVDSLLAPGCAYPMLALTIAQAGCARCTQRL